jgi:hypothetical protein
MKKNWVYHIIKNLAASIWIATILLASSCADNQISILKESSCELPCWNNIIAGQTSEHDVIQIISNLPIIKKDSIRITNQHWNIYDNQVFFSLNGRNSEVDIVDGTAKILWLCGNLSTTIEEITEKIGEPEKIISNGSIAGGRDVILINPKAGVSYFYNTRNFPEEIEFEIKPEIKVECLILFDKTFFAELMDSGTFSMGHYNAEETLSVMYIWNGYGNLDKKYPPRQP